MKVADYVIYVLVTYCVFGCPHFNRPGWCDALRARLVACTWAWAWPGWCKLPPAAWLPGNKNETRFPTAWLAQDARARWRAIFWLLAVCLPPPPPSLASMPCPRTLHRLVHLQCRAPQSLPFYSRPPAPAPSSSSRFVANRRCGSCSLGCPHCPPHLFQTW